MSMAKKHILLVEDNPDDEALALRALKKSNLANNISIARDGVEALDYIFCEGAHTERDMNQQPVVVLLDLKLPKVDGLEVLKRIKDDDRTKRMPVVIMTSSSEEQDMVSSYDFGANSYIRKPVDFNQFTEAVAQLGLYWLVMNEVPDE